jgi:hypothetical protein
MTPSAKMIFACEHLRIGADAHLAKTVELETDPMAEYG